MVESDDRWRSHFSFRSIVLWLLLASSFTTAVLYITPGLYGCDRAVDVVTVLTLLVALPMLLIFTNRLCHRRGFSFRSSRRVLFALLALYYLPIVYVDSQTHVMESDLGQVCTPTQPGLHKEHLE